MKKLFYSFIAASLTAVGLLTPKVANAEKINMGSLDLTVDGKDVTVNMENDFKDDGNCYPNFRFSHDAEAFPTGSKVVVNWTLLQNDVQLKDGATGAANLNDGNHTYCHLGILEGGTYELRLTFTFNIAGKDDPIIVAGKSVDMVVPEVKPTLQINTSVPAKEGTAATISYTTNLIKVTGDVTYTINLYEGNGVEGTLVATKTDANGSFDLSDLTVGTEYTYTVSASIKAGDIELGPVNSVQTWTQIAPQAHAKFAWTETSTAEGSDFNFTITPENFEANDIENILICVLKGGEGFNNEAEFHYEGTNLTGTIPVTFGGEQNNYWVRGSVKLTNGTVLPIEPDDIAITLHKKAAEKFDVTLTIAPNGDFERTSATGGNLPYKFTATGSLDQVDHYVVWASRAGDENMDETDVTELEGVLALTVLPADASTGVWIKVKAVSKTGAESATVQYGPITCDTRAVDSFTCSIWAGNTKAVTATTGTVDIKLTVANGENIQSYRVFVVTNGDKVVGEATLLSANAVEPAATAAETTVAVNGETEFTLDLANLNDKAVTELWAKVTPTNKAGAELTTAQYPGEAQGWTGLSIDTSTISSSIDEITAENPDAIVNVYNFSGVIVRKGVRAAEATDGLPAGLYIVGSKKVAVK